MRPPLESDLEKTRLLWVTQFQIIFKLNQLLLLLLFLEVNAQGIKATKNEGASFCLKLKKK